MYYFSRRGREHGGMSDYDVFDQVVQQQVSRDSPCGDCSKQHAQSCCLVPCSAAVGAGTSVAAAAQGI